MFISRKRLWSEVLWYDGKEYDLVIYNLASYLFKQYFIQIIAWLIYRIYNRHLRWSRSCKLIYFHRSIAKWSRRAIFPEPYNTCIYEQKEINLLFSSCTVIVDQVNIQFLIFRFHSIPFYHVNRGLWAVTLNKNWY